VPERIAYDADMALAAFDKDAVKAAMKAQKVSQTRLAEVLRIPQSGVSDLLQGKRQVKVQEADVIYRLLGIERVGGDVHIVPVIGLAAAGRWREAVEMPIAHLPVPKQVAGSRSFGVEVAGDSINLIAEHGAWLVVDPDDKALVAGKLYLLQNGDFEVTIKRYQKMPARFEPASTNPEHVAFEAGEVDFIVLGRVVWKGEKL
jgi:SOS-response transcriptional repressor LexA